MVSVSESLHFEVALLHSQEGGMNIEGASDENCRRIRTFVVDAWSLIYVQGCMKFNAWPVGAWSLMHSTQQFFAVTEIRPFEFALPS